jgi:hypothetical protein
MRDPACIRPQTIFGIFPWLRIDAKQERASYQRSKSLCPKLEGVNSDDSVGVSSRIKVAVVATLTVRTEIQYSILSDTCQFSFYHLQ